VIAGVVSAATLLIGSTVVVAVPLPRAEACSLTPDSDHCYAETYDSQDTPTGVKANLSFSCLHSPNGSDVVTQEVWIADSVTPSYWVENGMLDGYSNAIHQWFWADNRPNYGFSVHITSFTVNMNVVHLAKIYRNGTHPDWPVFRDSTQLGTSTPNDFTGAVVIGGSEYTTSGVRDVGTIAGIAYRDRSGSWHDIGTTGDGHPPFGPGHYVTDRYDHSTSTENITGPC